MKSSYCDANDSHGLSTLRILSSEDALAAMKLSAEHFGFGTLTKALSDEVLQELYREAGRQLSVAKHGRSESGGLNYNAHIAGLGSCALELLTSANLVGLLEAVFPGRYELSDNISCYTYYDSGSYLGVHRDSPADQCAVTIIVYLHAVSPDATSAVSGLALNVYGEDENSVGNVRLRIPTVQGSLVLGRGSLYWHERPRLQRGEEVIAITSCYRLVH